VGGYRKIFGGQATYETAIVGIKVARLNILLELLNAKNLIDDFPNSYTSIVG